MKRPLLLAVAFAALAALVFEPVISEAFAKGGRGGGGGSRGGGGGGGRSMSSGSRGGGGSSSRSFSGGGRSSGSSQRMSGGSYSSGGSRGGSSFSGNPSRSSSSGSPGNFSRGQSGGSSWANNSNSGSSGSVRSFRGSSDSSRSIRPNNDSSRVQSFARDSGRSSDSNRAPTLRSTPGDASRIQGARSNSLRSDSNSGSAVRSWTESGPRLSENGARITENGPRISRSGNSDGNNDRGSRDNSNDTRPGDVRRGDVVRSGDANRNTAENAARSFRRDNDGDGERNRDGDRRREGDRIRDARGSNDNNTAEVLRRRDNEGRGDKEGDRIRFGDRERGRDGDRDGRKWDGNRDRDWASGRDRGDDRGDHWGKWHRNNYRHRWVHGHWRGNWDRWRWNDDGWWWNRNRYFWGVSGWWWGPSIYNWGYYPYYNPYCQSVVVIGSVPYDYAQPFNVIEYDTPLVAAAENNLDVARNAFYNQDYAAALTNIDLAISQTPGDASLHQFRALILFARGDYEQAAATVHSILSVGPGWDWQTMRQFYPTVDVYTVQLRKLEDFRRANPRAAEARFLLAYHYLTTGYSDAAAKELQEVVAVEPNDRVASQLLQSLKQPAPGDAAGAEQPAQRPETIPSKPATPVPPLPLDSLPQNPSAPAAETQPDIKPLDAKAMIGNWKAAQPDGSQVELSLGADAKFTWKYTREGKTNEYSGTYTVANNLLILQQSAQESMIGRVEQTGEKGFRFVLMGGPPDDPGLSFTP